MPKKTAATKLCSKCNQERPETWFSTYKYDGEIRRVKNCKLCRESKVSLSSVETWNVEVFKDSEIGEETKVSGGVKASVEEYRKVLRFEIDPGAPDKYKKRWRNFKRALEEDPETSDDRRRILSSIVRVYNPGWTVMNRCEASIGENSSSNGKGFRFREAAWCRFRDDCIIIDQLKDRIGGGGIGFDEWIVGDLADVIKAVVKVGNEIIGEECISGYIMTEVVNGFPVKK